MSEHTSAPAASGPTPRAIRSTDPGDLASIYDPDVNLCIVEREPPPELERFVRRVLAWSTPLAAARTIRPEQFDARDLLPAELRGAAAESDSWCRDLAELIELFCALFEVRSVGLRLRTLDRPMCPRFHTDFVPARLICSYGGPGTQWLPEDAVDRRRLGSGSGGVPDEASGLIRRPEAAQGIPAYAIALLKGERWPGNEGRGAVHRSPRHATDAPERRLLLTLDLV